MNYLQSNLYASDVNLFTTGALNILVEANDILENRRDGDKEIVRSDFELMSEVLRLSYSIYQSKGIEDEFFNLNLNKFREPILEENLLFKILDINREPINLSWNSTQKSHIYIATVGMPNSGKGLIMDYLSESHNFEAYQLSDRVREFAAAYGSMPPFERQVLIDTGIKVRSIYGHGVSIHSVQRMFSSPNYECRLIFDGIRTYEEAEEFKKLASGNIKTILVGVKADEDEVKAQEIRYRRALKRGSAKDPKSESIEEKRKFVDLDNQEFPRINKAMELADFIVINKNGVEKETYKQFDSYLTYFL